MKLVSDWKLIVKKAWSVRLLIVAGLFSGAEMVLPLYADAIPRGPFAALSVVACICGLVARVVAQKGVANADA